jgi:hypothetical protein
MMVAPTASAALNPSQRLMVGIVISPFTIADDFTVPSAVVCRLRSQKSIRS